MSKKLRLILMGVLVVVALLGEQFVEFIKANVEVINTPSVDVVEPTISYKTLVQKIVDIDIEKEDATQISDFFAEVSDIVESDPGFIRSTGVFREFNVKSGGLNFAGLELKDKYPKLGEEIDSVIAQSLGLEDSELTEEKRKDLCDCLDAIAWSVHQ